MVEYHVPVAPGGVADIFDQLESNKNTLRIKHFSVSQTTLDEVRGRDKQTEAGGWGRGGEGGGVQCGGFYRDGNIPVRDRTEREDTR